MSRPLETPGFDGRDRITDAIRWSGTRAPAPSANDVTLCVADLQRVLGRVVARLAESLGPEVRIVTESRRCPPVRCDEEELVRWLGEVALALAQGTAGELSRPAEVLLATSVQDDHVRLGLTASPARTDTSEPVPPAARAALAGLGVALTQGARGGVAEVSLTFAAATMPGAAALIADPVTAVRRRVAVIDDDALVGRSIQRILGQQYDVELFTDARDALRRMDEGVRYALVLCDLMMPEMTGMAFCAALEATRPEVVSRCLWMTGGAFTPAAEVFIARRGDAVVEKPFDPRSLRTFVAERSAAVDASSAAMG